MSVKKVLMVHQGAELYGSDKIFALSVKSLVKSFDVHVVLDESGPLVDVLYEYGCTNVCIYKLGVIRRESLAGIPNFFGFIKSFLAAVIYFRRKIKREKYSLVYANTLAVVSPLVSARLCSIRAIHHIHEIQSSPRTLFRILYSISSLLSSLVVVVSKPVFSHCKEMYLPMISRTGKLVVLHNGIQVQDLDEESLLATREFLDGMAGVKTSDVCLVAMVGRIHFWKGQLEILYAIKKLKDKGINNFLVVFYGGVFRGYEGHMEKFRSTIDSLGISDLCLVAGERRDAQELFQLCGLAVLPSIQPDPLPTVVLEAMSRRKPVVAFRHGGAVEMISDLETGYLVDPCDFNSFSVKMGDLIGDEGLRERMGVNAEKRFHQKFSYHRYESEFLTLVESCITS